jgi:hypothetical protein
MIMQDDRLFYENLERRKSYMLRMFFSKLSSFVFIMFCVTSFLLIAQQAKAGALNPSSQAPVVVEADDILAGFWDLRNRESFFQVTNVTGGGITVHVQVWNASEVGFTDRCREFDFFDSYTGNDTHIYILSDLETNDGSVINPPPFDDGHGYIYVSVTGDGCTDNKAIIANHRIIDIPGGYEYRSAALGLHDAFDEVDTDVYGFNFNSQNDTTFSDVVPIIVDLDVADAICRQEPLGSSVLTNTVTLAEIRQSCAPLTVGCKSGPNTEPVPAFPDPVLVDLGINNALVKSRGGTELCTDTTPDGWVLLEYVSQFGDPIGCGPAEHQKSCGGLVGINNGDGTGSMESWTALDRTLNYFDFD